MLKTKVDLEFYLLLYPSIFKICLIQVLIMKEITKYYTTAYRT